MVQKKIELCKGFFKSAGLLSSLFEHIVRDYKYLLVKAIYSLLLRILYYDFEVDSGILLTFIFRFVES